MDAKIINAFLTECMKAFESMFGLQPEAKEPYLMDVYAGHPWEISGLLGITGDVRGVVAFRLHKILAGKMLSLSGIEFTPEEYEDTAIGLVSEFTNIIAGNAVSAIKDYSLDISPPFCVMGQNHQIAWPRKYPVIVIPFVTTLGPFEVDVCIK